MELYTFGLRYPDGALEEIDVNASSYIEARASAEEIARDGYEPGYTIEDLPPGGSGGLVQIWTG